MIGSVLLDLSVLDSVALTFDFLVAAACGLRVVQVWCGLRRACLVHWRVFNAGGLAWSSSQLWP